MHGASITKCSIGKHCLPAYNVMHIREALLLLGQVCNYWRRLVSEFAELLTLINIVIPPNSVAPVRLSRSGAFHVCLLTRMSPVRNFGKLGEWLRSTGGHWAIEVAVSWQAVGYSSRSGIFKGPWRWKGGLEANNDKRRWSRGLMRGVR